MINGLEVECKFFFLSGSISLSVMDKARVEFQERPGWVLRKLYVAAFGFKKHAFFCPCEHPGGAKTACFRCTQSDLLYRLLSRIWRYFPALHSIRLLKIVFFYRLYSQTVT